MTKTYLSTRSDLPAKASVTLTAAGWSGSTQTVSVSRMTTDCAVIVSPDVSSIGVCQQCEIYAQSQGNGTLTFSCSAIPTTNVIFHIVMVF